MKCVRNNLFLKTNPKPQWFKVLTIMMSASFLIACSDNDHDKDDKKMAKLSYEVEIINLTNGQPFSPLAIRVDQADYAAWEIGKPASVGLEHIAESGDSTEFLNVDSPNKTASGNGIVAPGDRAIIDVDARYDNQYLTAVTMLVNTNDAFSGITKLSLAGLDIGEQKKVYLPVYDAGTEENSEHSGTIPGPADGGEGFDVQRDDVNYVARHAGIVGKDEGYASSVLDGQHKFDGPVAMLLVTRTE